MNRIDDLFTGGKTKFWQAFCHMILLFLQVGVCSVVQVPYPLPSWSVGRLASPLTPPTLSRLQGFFNSIAYGLTEGIGSEIAAWWKRRRPL